MAKQITLGVEENGISFTFDESTHYLYGDGKIVCPKNSLILVTDESEMFTLKKANGDVFISARYDAVEGMSSKEDLVDWFVENAVGNVGGGIDPETLAELVSSAEYVSSSSTIDFKNVDGEVISTINAEPFITDGMVDNVQISGTNLVITWNTSAGKQPISIPLSSIFNPENYYDKSATDTLLNGKVAVSDYNAYTAATNTALSGKADVSAVTAVADSLSGKQDTLQYYSENTEDGFKQAKIETVFEDTENGIVGTVYVDSYANDTPSAEIYVSTEVNNGEEAYVKSADIYADTGWGIALTVDNGVDAALSFNVTADGVDINGDAVVTESMLSGKADTSAVTAISDSLSGKADTSAVTAAVDAVSATTDTKLADKQDTLQYYSEDAENRTAEIYVPFEGTEEYEENGSKITVSSSEIGIRSINTTDEMDGNLYVRNGGIDFSTVTMVGNGSSVGFINSEGIILGYDAMNPSYISEQLQMTNGAITIYSENSNERNTLSISPSAVTINDDAVATVPMLSGKADVSAVTAVSDALSGKADVSAVTACVFDFGRAATLGVTDDDWNRVMDAYVNHKPIIGILGDLRYVCESLVLATDASENQVFTFTVSDDVRRYIVSVTNFGNSQYQITQYDTIALPTTNDINNWNAKQDALVSGTNIKTVNNETLLGSGNLNLATTSAVTQAQYDAALAGGTLDTDMLYIITDASAIDIQNYYTKAQTDAALGGKVDVTDYNTYTAATATALSGKVDTSTLDNYYDKTGINSLIQRAYNDTNTALNALSAATDTKLANKQDTLVSGTNIKTINNESILGSGNISVSADLTNYYTKTEIDNMIGDIETLLQAI